MLALQSQVLHDRAVREVLGWQRPDGWLTKDFHGFKSMECGIRLLCEKGVDRNHPTLSSALEALGREQNRLYGGIGKVGRILDDTGHGGSHAIRAALFAQAGAEGHFLLKDQIQLALAAFEAVLKIRTLDDLIEEYKGTPVYRQGAVWPGIYHLRLLAYTHSWRTSTSLRRIAGAIQRLVALSPLPNAKIRHGSQLIAPASFCMRHFNPDMTRLDDAHWMTWFHRMELCSRLGIVHLVPELRAQVVTLKDMLSAGGGQFTKAVAHDYFRKWGAYTGLMLERDWRDPRRRQYDLTFRSLLILHYYEAMSA
jgi:hypothetical protein